LANNNFDMSACDMKLNELNVPVRFIFEDWIAWLKNEVEAFKQLQSLR
jgi:hypothetical protein